MATIVYIDGFNLYYGALKGTPHKWLVLAALSRRLLPKDQIVAIRYFTALVAARQGDPQQPQRQQAYLRALRTIPGFTVHLGHYLTHSVRMPLANPLPMGQGPWRSSGPRRRAPTWTLRPTYFWTPSRAAATQRWSSRTTPTSRSRSASQNSNWASGSERQPASGCAPLPRAAVIVLQTAAPLGPGQLPAAHRAQGRSGRDPQAAVLVGSLEGDSLAAVAFPERPSKTQRPTRSGWVSHLAAEATEGIHRQYCQPRRTAQPSSQPRPTPRICTRQWRGSA
jgi:hypothetical protein